MDPLGFEKLIYHYNKIEKIRNTKNQFPVNLTVSLGNFCNHGCLWCTVYMAQEKEARHADMDSYLSFFRRCAKRGLKAVSYVGNGEPTAYPKFRQFITLVNEMGLQQGMFTNGYLLDRYMDEILNYFTFLRVSLDAGSTDVHNAMHNVNGHFEKIIANLREITTKRKGDAPTVGVQYATHQDNIRSLYRCAEIISDIGVDYLSVKPVFNWGGGANEDRIARNNLEHSDLAAEIIRIRKDFERDGFDIHYRPFQIESIIEDGNVFEYDRCVAGFFNLNMYEDGNLTCCSPHKVSVGTIDEDIEVLEQRISDSTRNLNLDKCPPSCRYHPMNHLIHTILHPDQSDKYHKNFL
jgi:MoaA/NifB/PqqE/SkfB family radical SAM enzyme